MKQILIIAAALMAAATANAQDTMSRPEISIVDQVSLLKPEESSAIQAVIDNFYKAKQGLAYLLIIDSLPDGQNILGYTKGLFKKWDLNNYGAGLNFLIVYSVKDHAVRIEGTDKVIQLTTKQYLQDVTTNSMMPYFRKRQDYQALKRGIEMVAIKIENN
jgi:uncharacterized membrane protein YgcG